MWVCYIKLSNLSNKTTIAIHSKLWKRIHNLQKTPVDSKEMVIEEAITLLEQKRSEQ